MRFNIDPKTRIIDNNYSKLGTQGESNIEIVEFVMPKTYNNVDFFAPSVRCILAMISAKNQEVIKVLKISELDKDNFLATWEVGNEETADVGFLKAAIHFSTAFDNAFRTLPTTFEVMETINVKSEQPVLFSSRRSAPTMFAVEPETEIINVLENKLIVPAKLQNIAVQNDNESRKVKIVMPRYYQTEDLSKYPINLHVVTAGGGYRIPFTPQLSGADITLVWIIERPATSYAGAVQFQIEIGDLTTDTFFKSTEFATVNILTALSGEQIIPVSPPEFLEYLKQIEAVKQEAVVAKDMAVSSAIIAQSSAETAMEYSERYPIVGPNGFWMKWDVGLNKYVETDTQASVMYATFFINPQTGILSMTTAEQYKGANFAINESGHLEVII